MLCVECNSSNVNRKGLTTLSNGLIKQRYKCKDCGAHFALSLDDDYTDDMFDDDIAEFETVVLNYDRSLDWIQQNIYSKKTVVITAAQNNTPINQGFLNALKVYTDTNNAAFVVIPIKHKTINSEDDRSAIEYDAEIADHLIENTLEWQQYKVRVYAGIKIQATAENPLSGLDPLSKGYSVIVGHAQVQLRTLPNMDKRISDILTTTGAITEKNYSKTKLGEKARFNHSLSAIVLEFDDNNYHLRHLNYDAEKQSFWDLDTEYSGTGTRTGNVAALVTGDEHAIFRDTLVEKHTYTNDDSMVNVLKPEYIIRHDVLDSYSISHHHKKNLFTSYAKFKSGINDIESEIQETIDYINYTTPDFSRSMLVQSNHNEHLLRWLNEVNIKEEPWNAKIYHYLMYHMILETKMGENGAIYPDPFELISKNHFKDNVEFVDRSGASILGIEIGAHGDIGVNGARGSAKSFSRMPGKTITGHSHSPAIEKGAYVVGTSSKLSLEYNKGASTWHHAHVIIHKNGKRQMVFITPSGWRL